MSETITPSQSVKPKRPNRNVYIGKAYDDWQTFKRGNNLTTDTDVAFHLLSMFSYYTTDTCQSTVDISEQGRTSKSDSAKATTSSGASKVRVTSTPLQKTTSTMQPDAEDSSSSAATLKLSDGISGVSSIHSSPEWVSDVPTWSEMSAVPKDCSNISDRSYRPTDESIKMYQNEAHNNDIHYHMLDYEMSEQPINDSELEIHVPEIEECFPTQQNTRAITKAEDLKNEVPYIGYLSSLAEVINHKTCNKCGKEMPPSTSTFSTAAVVTWKCETRKCGTKYKWYSQPSVKDRRGTLLGNFSIATNIPLSGNNYSKVSLLLKFMGLSPVPSITYHNIQTHYVQPTVEQHWRSEQKKLAQQMAGKPLVVAADGRCDSPGHCAQYTTYTVMEHNTNDILCTVVVDKREVQLKSPNMERLGLERALDELKRLGFHIAEVVTDAHIQVPPVLVGRGIHHSWDVWHGGKSLAKKLREVAKKKENRDLEPWIKDLVNHFWHSSKEANGNSLQFKNRFLGCLRHIVDVHDWATGQCDHEADIQQEKKYLQPGSEPHTALTNICRSTPWLDKASKKFANFRHTAELESHHNVMLKYASKRFSFGFREYTCRMQLAALDHQHHLSRKPLKDAGDNLRYKAVYSKKTDMWTPVVVKEHKTFDHIPALQEDVLNARLGDPFNKRRPAKLAANDPSHIQPNLAPRPAPPLQDMVAKKKSRYQ